MKNLKTKLLTAFWTLLLLTVMSSGSVLAVNSWSGGTYTYSNGTLTLNNGTYTVTAPLVSSTASTWTGLNVTGPVTTLNLNNSNIVFASNGYANTATGTQGNAPYAVTAVEPYVGFYATYAGLLVNNTLTINSTGSSGLTVSGSKNVAPVVVQANNKTNASLTTTGALVVTAAPTQQTYYDFKGATSGKNADVAIAVQSYPGYTATLNIGTGAKITGAPAVIVGGQGDSASATITGATLQAPANLGGNNSQAVLRDYYIADRYNATTSITVNNSTVSGGTNYPGIYADSPNGAVDLTNTNVSGYSGIVSRAGAMNISGGSVKGTGAQRNQSESLYSDIGSGAAITVPASATSYGNTKLTISGSTLESTNNAAITNGTRTGYDGLTSDSTITNTKLVGAEKPNITDASGSSIKIFGDGVSSNQKLDYNNVNITNPYEVTTTNNSNNQYTYFSNQDKAVTYSQENDGTITQINSSTGVGSSVSQTQELTSITLDGTLQYHNSGSSQTQSVGYKPEPNTYAPNKISWEISESAGSNDTVDFGSFTLNTSTNTWTAASTDSEWTLSFANGTTNVLLTYKGTGLPTGSYTLTANGKDDLNGDVSDTETIQISAGDTNAPTLTVTPNPVSLNYGSSATLTASLSNVLGSTITYTFTNSNPNVIAIESQDPTTTGQVLIVAVGPGSASIEVTAVVGDYVKTYSTTVSVTVSGNYVPAPDNPWWGGGGYYPPFIPPYPNVPEKPETPESPEKPESPEPPATPEKPENGFIWWVPGAEDESNTTPPETEEVTIYRLYNMVSGEYLYTPFQAEVSYLTALGDWRSEGVAWEAPVTGVPVYRLYNPNLGTHLYTTDTNEVSVLQTQGWVLDNDGMPVFYSGGDVPVYRLYNPNSFRHLLTIDLNEYNILSENGWNPEGIAFYAES